MQKEQAHDEVEDSGAVWYLLARRTQAVWSQCDDYRRRRHLMKGLVVIVLLQQQLGMEGVIILHHQKYRCKQSAKNAGLGRRWRRGSGGAETKHETKHDSAEADKDERMLGDSRRRHFSLCW